MKRLLFLNPLLVFILFSLVPNVSAQNWDYAASIIDEYNLIIAGIMIGIGLILMVAGYYLFKTTLFCFGAVFFGLAFFTIIEKILDAWGSADWVPFTSITVSIVAALIGGVVVVKVVQIGIFIIGATMGILLAALLNTAFLYKVYPDNPDYPLYISVGILGIAGGILAHKAKDPLVIGATSFVGAYGFIRGIGLFAGNYPPETNIPKYPNGNIHIPWQFWAYTSGIFLCGIVGSMIQFYFTSPKGVERVKEQRRRASLAGERRRSQVRRRSSIYDEEGRRISFSSRRSSQSRRGSRHSSYWDDDSEDDDYDGRSRRDSVAVKRASLARRRSQVKAKRDMIAQRRNSSASGRRQSLRRPSQERRASQRRPSESSRRPSMTSRRQSQGGDRDRDRRRSTSRRGSEDRRRQSARRNSLSQDRRGSQGRRNSTTDRRRSVGGRRQSQSRRPSTTSRRDSLSGRRRDSIGSNRRDSLGGSSRRSSMTSKRSADRRRRGSSVEYGERRRSIDHRKHEAEFDYYDDS